MQATEVLEPADRGADQGDRAAAGGGAEGRSTGGRRADELGRLLAETRRRRLLLEATVGALKAERAQGAGRPAGTR